ncbi:MAG: hypothetical protein RSB82_02820 [Victivallaceae bacterium]
MQKLLLSFLITLTTFNVFGTESIKSTNKESIPHISSLESQKESVVCIHAFLRSYTSLKPIGRVMDKENYEVFLWNYETRKFTLEGHADNLVKLLKKIAQLKPGVPINFVTHSIGGVILRVALSRDDCPEEAKKGRAVLMAPPNAGSELARRYKCVGIVQFVFGGKLGRQLLTYEPEQMLSIAQIPDSVDVLVISGRKKSRFIPFKMKDENDGKVRIKETLLNTKYTHAVINVNHTYIITDKDSLSMMKNFITENKVVNTNPNQSRNKTNKIHIIHCVASKPGLLIGFPQLYKKP